MPQPHKQYEAAEVMLAAREDKNKALKNKFLDAWFELYPKDYNKYHKQASGKEQQMILWFFKGHGRKSVQMKIFLIMDRVNGDVKRDVKPVKTSGK